MVVVGMSNPLKRPVIKKTHKHQRGVLQLNYIKNHIVYRLPLDSLHDGRLLSIYAGSRKVAETEIGREKNEGLLMPDSISGTVAYGIVTGNDNEILTARSVALKSVPLPAFTLLADNTSVRTGEPVGITLKGGAEAVCLMVRLEKAEAPPPSPATGCGHVHRNECRPMPPATDRAISLSIHPRTSAVHKRERGNRTGKHLQERRFPDCLQ